MQAIHSVMKLLAPRQTGHTAVRQVQLSLYSSRCRTFCGCRRSRANVAIHRFTWAGPPARGEGQQRQA